MERQAIRDPRTLLKILQDLADDLQRDHDLGLVIIISQASDKLLAAQPSHICMATAGGDNDATQRLLCVGIHLTVMTEEREVLAEMEEANKKQPADASGLLN
jgi:hypothetical protein